MCSIFMVSGPQSCHASNKKLSPIYLFPQSLSISVMWTDLICFLSQFRLCQCLSKIILLARDHHPLSKAWNTSFTIKTKLKLITSSNFS